MKLKGNFKEWSVTQTQLGKILNLSQSRINQLIDEGIIIRDETSKSGAVLLIDSLREYFSSKNPNRDGDKSADFWKERALNERAKREMNELKLAERRGELYEAAIVENTISETVVNFRSKILGLPNKFATRLEGKSRERIFNLLNSELNDLLNELAENLRASEFESVDEAESEDDGGD